MLNFKFLLSLTCVIQLACVISTMSLSNLKRDSSSDPFGQIRLKNANMTEIKKLLDIVLNRPNNIKRIVYTSQDALKDLTDESQDYIDNTKVTTTVKSFVTTTPISTTTEKQEQDLFAYLFKIESNDDEQSSKNVLFSKENIGSGLQYVDNERLAPKVNTKILAKLFEILNKNFLDGVNKPELVHKTHDFYDNFYNTLIQELELVEDEINEVNVPTEPENSLSEFIKLPEETNTKTNKTDESIAPYIKKIFRLKRVKSIKDLITEVSTRDQEDVDYGTILYVGKRNKPNTK